MASSMKKIVRFSAKATIKISLLMVFLLLLWFGKSVGNAVRTADQAPVHGNNYSPVFEQNFDQSSGNTCNGRC